MSKLIEVDEILDKSLNVLIEQFVKENNYLTEVANFVLADDGPGMWINYKNYRRHSGRATEELGWEILNYLVDKEIVDSDISDYRKYPNGPVNAVSFGPAGIENKLTTMNQVDADSKTAYDMWKKHIEFVNSKLAWTFINWYDPSTFEGKF